MRDVMTSGGLPYEGFTDQWRVVFMRDLLT
jgi:hypothetical protein